MTEQNDSRPKASRQTENAYAARGNLREVAEKAGVALSSVSRVLSGHPDVSPQMRERVLAAAEELGYEPNLLWQSLRHGATRTAGIVIRDISSPLWSEMVFAADLALQQRGYSMLLANSEGLPSLDVSHIRLLCQRRVDGLLLSVNDTTHQPTLDTLRRLRIPFVSIDRDLPGPLGAASVLVDHAAGMRAAAAHLIELGHRSIGLVTGPETLRPAGESLRALRAVCLEHGVAAQIEAGAFTSDHGATGVTRLLESTNPPTAVIAGSNQIFPGVLTVLRARGVRIPQDLSVVTFDDLPLLSCIDPPVAVVSREPRTVGEQAAKLLLGLLDGNEPTTVTVRAIFQPRASCGPPAAL